VLSWYSTHQPTLRVDPRATRSLLPEPFKHLSPCPVTWQRPNLPKASLADPGRPEYLRHLAAHVPAQDIVAWEARRGEEPVELRDAGGYCARSACMETLEGLRCRYGGQSV
jgi:hypothetical protein